MPNIVRYGNTQIPTNAMLGDLAFQDSVGEINLEKIKARSSNTAASGDGTSIFVYDTRKDSDGGAWRKRTQNTSWYNEKPSATRGTRKEFPSIAVIVFDVSGTNKVTIYDGDDPNLPMWMVFNSVYTSNNYGGLINILYSGYGGIHALNGVLVGGRSFVSFIDDNLGGYWHTNGFYRGDGEGIVQRNKLFLHKQHSSHGIGNNTVYDVSMTVLPEAAIDTATGLPTPTIAFGTAGGFSVTSNLTSDAYGTNSGNGGNGGLKESKVYDMTGFSPVKNIGFSNDRLFIHTMNGTTTYGTIGHRKLTGDITLDNWEFGDQWNTARSTVGRYIPKSHTKALVTSENKLVFGGASATPTNGSTYLENRGFFQIQTDDDVENNGDNSSNKCEITTTYNTGWIHGDARRTNLATTDSSSNLSSTNLLTNGDFSNGTTGWTPYQTGGVGGSNNSLVINGSGQAVWTVNAGQYWFFQEITSQVVPGKTYMLSATLVSRNSNSWMRVGTSNAGSGDILDAPNWSSAGTSTDYFFTVPVGFTGNLYVQFGTQSGTGNNTVIDNVVLTEADPERSYSSLNTKHMGLRPYGTINRNPVESGAELVGYSNWGSSNYFIGRYFHSNDNPGSGDYSVKAWVKTNTDHTGVFWSIRNASSSSVWLQFWLNTSERIEFGSSSGRITKNYDIIDGNWHCLYGVKNSNNLLLYVDGILVGSTSSHADPGLNSSSVFRIGNHYDNNHPLQGSLALISYSQSAPSPEMVKKIYLDEKYLFRKDAKCTLYGTSDVVTALGHDDTTKLLHVGTSSGRSDFRGLNRINNTTTAVTNAISASNGLIAEQ